MENKVCKMRKNNMRIFPIYKRIAWDYLFFYTIDFLFLTQAKGISASNVVLKSTFFAFFITILQIPSNVIIEFLGRKNSLVFGNILNCLYIVVIMASKDLGDLIFAEFLSATAVSIKQIVENSMLNESIAPSKYKNTIFEKFNSKGLSGYYFYNAISKVIGGYLFVINPYLPMVCSLTVLIIVVILSIGFVEPVQKKKSSISLYKVQLKEMKQGFDYVFKSERLKALILCSALMQALLLNLANLYTSLLKDLNLSAIIIGIISAAGSILSAYSSNIQEKVQKRLKNKTLIITAFIISISTAIAGVIGVGAKYLLPLVIVVAVMDLIYNFANGIYNSSIERYLRNFTNEKIDTKIFAARNLVSGIVRIITGLFASFLLARISTDYSMLIMGIVFTIIYILTGKYMKERVGLKPEEYSKEERKYDEQKVVN